MKRICLIIFVLLTSTSAFSQNVLGLFKSANDFFDLMKAEKFTEAHAFFDSTLKEKLPENKLQELWSSIITNLGEAESLNAISSKTQGEFFAVTVEGKFKNSDQNFLLGFNKDQKIVGIFVSPKPISQAYILPTYADSTLYTEKQIYIGVAGKQLAAVVTIPKNIKNFPIVVFVHGSGPSDMDESVGPNKPFKDLASGLASNGIASLRYVKRTLVYPNEFVGAFTVNDETINDALSAITAANGIAGANKKAIYVFGHSLGGMLAPRIAAKSPTLSGIILAAAPARNLLDVIVEQSNEAYKNTKDTTVAGKTQMAEFGKEIERARLTKLGAIKADSVILGLPASYWLDLNTNNQVGIAKKLSATKIFILQGGNDFQVSKTDFDLWQNALKGKKNVALKFYPTLNHFLSEQTEKGTVVQYNIPAHVSEVLLKDVVSWIKDK